MKKISLNSLFTYIILEIFAFIFATLIVLSKKDYKEINKISLK